jgi:hypothetical protein
LCPARGCSKALEWAANDQVEGKVDYLLVGAGELQIHIGGGDGGQHGGGEFRGKDEHRNAAGTRLLNDTLVALGAPFEQHGGAWAAALKFTKALLVVEGVDRESRVGECFSKGSFKAASEVKEGLHPYLSERRGTLVLLVDSGGHNQSCFSIALNICESQ